jgi:hypothetical protein
MDGPPVYIQKHFSEDEVSKRKLKMAVPIFHAYGHQVSCQVKGFCFYFHKLYNNYFAQVTYRPRRVPGFGLVDGGAIERLWAYLRPFVKITREMTPSHRENLLAAALMHFAIKKEKQLGEFSLRIITMSWYVPGTLDELVIILIFPVSVIISGVRYRAKLI